MLGSYREVLPGSSSGLSLRSNFLWTLGGNVVYAGCQWALLIILAKLGSPEKVGQYALGIAITAPLFAFSQLQLRAVQVTDARVQFLFGDYLGLRLITTAAAFLVAAAIVLGSGYQRTVALVVIFVALARGFESISDVFYGVQQQRERLDRVAKAAMLRGPLSLAALTLGFWVTGSVSWGAFGLVLAGAVMLAFYDAPRMLAPDPAPPFPEKSPGPLAAFRLDWRRPAYVALFRLAFPLGVVMMLCSLIINIPRYFVKAYEGEAGLGIFAALAYLMAVGNIVIGACGQAAAPRLAKYHASGDLRAFYGLVRKLVGVGGFCGGLGVLASVVAGREILTLLYRPEYARHAEIFVGLACVAVLNYIGQFLGYVLTAARLFRAQVPLFAVVAAAVAAGCWFFVPAHGLLGAVLAMGLAGLIQIGGSLLLLVRGIRTRWEPESASARCPDLKTSFFLAREIKE